MNVLFDFGWYSLASHSSLHISTLHVSLDFLLHFCIILLYYPPVLYCWPNSLNLWTYSTSTLCASFSTWLPCIHTHALYFKNVPLYTSSCIKHILFFTYAPIYKRCVWKKMSLKTINCTEWDKKIQPYVLINLVLTSFFTWKAFNFHFCQSQET